MRQKEVWEPSKTIPDNAESPTFLHDKLKKPSAIYSYHNSAGSLVGYALRYELPKGKIVMPYCYGKLNNKVGWHFKSLARPTPLYGAEDLARKPDRPVLIVEGEKTKDASKIRFSSYVSVTSFGGSNSANKTDWSDIKGRKICIFRDNDDAGKKYMDEVIQILRKLGTDEVFVVNVPTDFPASWDVADALPEGWDDQRVLSLIDKAEPTVFKKEEGKATKSADIVKALFSSLKYRLLLDQHEDSFIFTEEKKGYSTSIPIRSPRFRKFLRRYFFENFQEPLPKDAIEQILDVLDAQALSLGSPADLMVRTAKIKDAIYYDLGDAAVEINGGGWTITKEIPPIFRKYQMTKNQAHPIVGGCLKNILSFVNIPNEDDKLLFLVFIVTSLVPNIPHPILSIFGPQGSAKSTLMRILVRLIDPCATDDVQFYDRKEFIQAISHRLVVPLDNLSKISPDESDLLCKVVTGGGFSKRMLYSDDDDKIVSFRRIVLMNGINLVVTRSDLLDRCILMELDKILPKNRMTEAQLFSELEMQLPGLLGSCFDLVSSSLKFYDEALSFLNEPPRMADFAVWGCAVAKSLGYEFEDFISAYRGNIRKQNEEAIEASPLATAICYFLRDNEKCAGTPTEVLRKLKAIWEPSGCDTKDFPGSVFSFGKRLNAIVPNLESIGIRVERSKSNERQIKIYFPKQNVLSVLPPIDHNDNERTEDGSGSGIVHSSVHAFPSPVGDLGNCDTSDTFNKSGDGRADWGR